MDDSLELEYDGSSDIDFVPNDPDPLDRAAGTLSQQQPLPHIKKRIRRIYPKRPKVLCEWTHEDILKLIKAVEERPTLWDKANVGYKLGKLWAWQEVDEIVGNNYTPDECKAKWNTLRVTFNINLTKKRSIEHNSDEKKEISWRYFNTMMFLEPVMCGQTFESISSIPMVIYIICF